MAVACEGKVFCSIRSPLLAENSIIPADRELHLQRRTGQRYRGEIEFPHCSSHFFSKAFITPYLCHYASNYIWQEGLHSFSCTRITHIFLLSLNVMQVVGDFERGVNFGVVKVTAPSLGILFFFILITIVCWIYWQGPAWLGRRRSGPAVKIEAMIRGLTDAAQSSGSHPLYSHRWASWLSTTTALGSLWRHGKNGPAKRTASSVQHCLPALSYPTVRNPWSRLWKS